MVDDKLDLDVESELPDDELLASVNSQYNEEPMNEVEDPYEYVHKEGYNSQPASPRKTCVEYHCSNKSTAC